MRRHSRSLLPRSSARLLLVGLLLLAVLPGSSASASGVTSLQAGFDDALVAHLDQVTDITPLPAGGALLVQKAGVVRRLVGGVVQPTPVLDVRTGLCTTSERGLLSVAVDPAYATNGWIYTFRTVNAAGRCVQRVSRFTVRGESAGRGSEKVLVDGIPAWTSGAHSGGDMVFGADGKLYVTVGDGYCDYAGDSGCNLANDAGRDDFTLLGKLLRINKDGSVPADDPWVGAGAASCAAGNVAPGQRCSQVWAKGLRSPFRMAASADGKVLQVNDVGAGSWEEVDRVVRGADYGWNLREGPCRAGSYTDCTPDPRFTDPIHAYRHDTTGCASVTGAAFVPPSLGWPAEFAGSYLFSDFVCGKIFVLNPDGSSRVFASGLEPGSAVAMAFVDGALLYTTWGGGEVRAIRHTGEPARAPQAVLTASPASASPLLTTTLSGAGSYDLDGGALTYLWDFGDGTPAEQTTTPTVEHSYPQGSFTAVLRVQDEGGLVSEPGTIVLNSGDAPPVPTIVAPADGTTFFVGQRFTLHGTATDAEDGDVPSGQLRWDVVRVHGMHEHPLVTDAPDLTSFRAPELEALSDWKVSWLALRLTATDSAGVSTTTEQLLKPRLVKVQVTTSPAGVPLFVNGQVSQSTVYTSWAGGELVLSAPETAVVNGRTLAFQGWSDGGARTHSVRPRTYTPYTASYG